MEDGFLQQAIVDSLNSNRLELTILPTEKCNFRCTYCYEDFVHGRMPQGIVEGIKNLISIRSEDLLQLHISWFGGEPLLVRSQIFDISKHAKLAMSDNGKVFTSDMTTNGYLLDLATATACISNGVRSFQISIDGNEDTHNISRVLKGGGATFERIWDNLIALRDSDLEFYVQLRVHFLADRLEDIFGMIDLLRDNFRSDDRFRVYPKAIVRLGGGQDEKIPLITHSEEMEVVKKVLNAIYGSENSIANLQNDEMPICYASKANAFVVRSDGRIGKCTVALRDERNCIGHINEVGELVISNEKHIPWIKGLFSRDASQLGCPWSTFEHVDA